MTSERDKSLSCSVGAERSIDSGEIGYSLRSGPLLPRWRGIRDRTPPSDQAPINGHRWIPPPFEGGSRHRLPGSPNPLGHRILDSPTGRRQAIPPVPSPHPDPLFRPEYRPSDSGPRRTVPSPDLPEARARFGSALARITSGSLGRGFSHRRKIRRARSDGRHAPRSGRADGAQDPRNGRGDRTSIP